MDETVFVLGWHIPPPSLNLHLLRERPERMVPESCPRSVFPEILRVPLAYSCKSSDFDQLVQLATPIQKQDFILLVTLATIETVLFEDSQRHFFCGPRNLLDRQRYLHRTCMKGNVRQRHDSDTSPSLIHDRDSPHLVFLHQLFTFVDRGLWFTGDGNRSHDFRDGDRVAVFAASKNATTEISIRYDPLHQWVCKIPHHRDSPHSVHLHQIRRVTHRILRRA